MSATFWNMRRRKKAKESLKTETVTSTSVPEKETEKPVKKGGGKNGK